MSRRRVTPLTSRICGQLPGRCGDCVFWELGSACPLPGSDRVLGDRGVRVTDGAGHKREWVSAHLAAGEDTGSAVVVDDEVVAYALFAPVPAFARRGSTVPRPSPTALQLATIFVRPAYRQQGVGRVLVHAAVRAAVRSRHPAVEAYGDRRFRERSCVLPATWLLHEGFEVVGEHPQTPLLRLDVRRTVRWSASLEDALAGVLGRVPRTVPEPVGASRARLP